MCYNNYRKKEMRYIKMMYWKSVYTGQIHEVDFIPKFGGWELSTKEEYEEQQKNFEKK